MYRSRNGVYERSQTEGVDFSAFIPNPLPPIPPLDMDQFHQGLEAAHLALGYLDAMIARLPSIEPVLFSYVRREAIASSQIEGTQSTFEDLLTFELGGAPSTSLDDAAEVSNYVSALQHGISRLRDGFPISSRLIREVHEILMQGEARRHLMPGEYRRSQNWIGGSSPATAMYVPPPPDDVLDCMSQLEQFIHDERSTLPIVIKAGLAHAQFESIHPFLDGNGRAGRLLIALMLEASEVLSEPALYLSLYFKQRRPEYYSLLGQLRDNGDWELWLRYFVDGVLWTAEDCIAVTEELSARFDVDQQQLRQLGRRATSVVSAHEAFARRPMLNLRELSNETGLSLNAAASATDTLIELGIVAERTGQRRNRIFAYDAYISILSRGGQPF